MDEEYRKRGADLKRLYLCFQGKIWLLFMLTVLGAVLGGVIYQVVRAMRMPIAYEGVSKLYISFNVDESGEVYQYYNGYTWNDLLDSEPILNKIMAYVPSGYTREEVKEATSAEILSDIRLLTVTVTGETEKYVREIQQAVEAGLTEYAGISEELKRIEVIQSRDPVRVYWDNRGTYACIAGAVLFALVSGFMLAFSYILNEAIYVQSDIEKKYPVKALGLLMQKQSGLQPYARELQANFGFLLKENKRFAMIDMGDHADLRRLELELVLNAGEGKFVGGDGEAGGLTWTIPDPEPSDFDEEEPVKEKEWNAVPFNQNFLSEKELAEIRSLGGAVILVPFGEDVSRRLARVLNLLQNQDCRVLGMVIAQADEDFLNRYYK